MTYLARFKANLAAGSAFGGNKMKKTVSVKPQDDKSVEYKTVINWDAIFVEPNTAQGVVAMVIMASFAILAAPLAIPLAMLAGWAMEQQEREEVEYNKRPVAAGVAYVTLVLPVVAAFVAIRLVVTPFTELANLAKSAYKAATSKDSDVVEPPKYDVKQISSKIIGVAKHVWTLGLLLLVPAIKRLVTLDGQIEGLKDRLTAVELKREARMRELQGSYDELRAEVLKARFVKPFDAAALKKANKALNVFERERAKEVDSFDVKLKGIENEITTKEKALDDKKAAEKAEKLKAQPSKESASPLPASASSKASVSPITGEISPDVPPMTFEKSTDAAGKSSRASGSPDHATNPSSSTDHVVSLGSSTRPGL